MAALEEPLQEEPGEPLASAVIYCEHCKELVEPFVSEVIYPECMETHWKTLIRSCRASPALYPSTLNCSQTTVVPVSTVVEGVALTNSEGH